MGTVRISHIINPDGKVAPAYPKVTPADHALQLLGDLKELKAEGKKGK